MPTKSIYFPDELWDQIEEEVDDDDYLSVFVQEAIRRELEGEFDELEELTEDLEDLRAEVGALQEWKEGVMAEIVDWFTGETSPAQ